MSEFRYEWTLTAAFLRRYVPAVNRRPGEMRWFHETAHDVFTANINAGRCAEVAGAMARSKLSNMFAAGERRP